MNSVDSVLYTSQIRKKCYLVPPDLSLPPGDFVIRDVTGHERSVDPAALAPFEVSARQARRHLLRRALELIGDATGSPDLQLRDLLRLPWLTARGGLRLLSGFRALLAGVTSGDSETQVAAREQMRALQRWLAARGIETSEPLESLPDRLRGQYRKTGELEQLAESAVALEEVSGQLDVSLAAVAAERGKGLAEIRKHARMVRSKDRENG
jgi:hypothetical protein